MALFRVKRKIENSVWKLTFINDSEYLSEGDINLMRKFGEPEINVGGTFLGETDDEFTLPVAYVKIRSGLPYTATFDTRDEIFAEETLTKVNGYQTEIIERMTEAMTTLRDKSDTFTSEATYQI